MSIFKNQLTFQTLTPERKLILQIELALYLWMIPILYLGILSIVRKKEINAFTRGHLEPVVIPIRNFVQTVVLPPLAELSRSFHFPTETLQACSVWLKGAAHVAGALFFPVMALVIVGLAIAYHSGLYGTGRRRVSDGRVLQHEIHKWKIRLFEARIDLLLTPKSWLRTTISTVILFATSCAIIFGIFSGCFAAFCPIFFPLFEPGMTNWLIACLHDASIKTPQSWSDYTSAYSTAISMATAHNREIAWILPIPGISNLVSPPDLTRFRIFAAALCSVIGAFPFTLSTLALGIDSIGDRRLTLTPTRLLDIKRSFYFFFRTKQYRWTDLVKASLVGAKSDQDETLTGKILSLEFSNKRLLTVSMEQLNAKNQEILIQALAELAPVCQFNDELKQLMSQPRGESAAGYTIFWDDELSKKRRSTVFSPLEQGKMLRDGRLEILRQLSGQGWSATYLARCNGELVVVRESLLSDETEAGRRAWATLEKECKILGLLNHKGIARVIDHFVEGGRSYLLLEYIVGTDLRKKTSLCSQLSANIVIEIAERICDILDYLHKQDPVVIHRDISPDNLVVTPDGDVKLIDFAASKQCIETATGTMIGKRSYMAPEQLRGKASVRSDIYSLGATLYYLLTGQDPIALTQCRAIDHRPDIDLRLSELIEEMTSFDENSRPGSVAQIKQRVSSLREECTLLEKMFDGLASESMTIKLNQYEAEKL